MLTITFTPPTVKQLSHQLQAAFRQGALRLIKRITALLLLADQQPAERVAQRLGVARSTIYSWLHAFLVDRWASLRYRTSPGRPAKLSASQKQRLKALICAGPQAAGYRTGCSPSALIQDLIVREFGRLYNIHYLSELLRNAGTRHRYTSRL